MEIHAFIIAFVFLSLLLLVGKWIRIKLTLFQKYFIPSSIIAGLFGLLLGPSVLGEFIPMKNGLFTNETLHIWKMMPETLITIIFAALFLGKTIPNPKEIWKKAGPQVSFGQTVAWGQYVIGLLLALLVLTPLLGLPPAAGALIEISFQGGPGTAAGLASTFESIDFAEGADLALGLATIGVLSGIVSGIVIINWGIRNNKTKYAKSPSELSKEERKGIITDEKERVPAGLMTTKPQSIEAFTIHVAHIGAAIGIGILVQFAFIKLEELTWGSMYDVYILKFVPLFPLAMVGGVLIQLCSKYVFGYKIINRELIVRIQGFALDLLIVAAIATLSLNVISENLTAFIIIALSGIGWNLIAFLLLAPRMIPTFWFERGVVDLGQSMGMTTTGLLLLQIVDPERKSPSFESFGYKQLLFEPVVGGGLFTASSLPLIMQFGPIPILILTLALFFFWLLIGLLHFGRIKEHLSN